MYGYERYLEEEDGSIESIRIFLNMEEETVPLPEELLGGENLWQEGLKEGQLAAKRICTDPGKGLKYSQRKSREEGERWSNH